MKRFFALLFIALISSCKHSPPQTSFNSALRDELLRMEVDDQAARVSAPKNPTEIQALMAMDARHTSRMKEIVAAYGWPGYSIVGKDASSAAWLLVQHADSDPEFQRRILTLIEPLVKSGEVKASHYAYLWDRTHEPQRYGTQGRCVANGRWEPLEIETPSELDTRRTSLGMPTMAEYVKIVSEICPG